MSRLALYAVKIAVILQKKKKRQKEKKTVFFFLHFCNILRVFTIALHPCQAPYQNKAMQGQAIWDLSVSCANEKLQFLAQACWSLTPNSFHVCPFAGPGMGRIQAWTLLSKAIVAGFLCWLQSPNTLCFAVRVAFWCLGLLLGLADLISIIFLCCGHSPDLPFLYNQCCSSVTFLTLPGDHLL